MNSRGGMVVFLFMFFVFIRNGVPIVWPITDYFFYVLLHNFNIIWCIIGVILHMTHYVSRFFATIFNPLLGWGNEGNQVYVLGVYYILLLHFHNVFIKKKEAKKKKKNCSSTYVCLLLRTDIIYIIMYTREVNDMKNCDFSLCFGS